MKRICTILPLALILLLSSCQKQTIEEPTKYVKDGVIVWQKPLWKVPNDTAYYVMSFFKPYFQFDNKVIVETYKNGKGGIRCMEVETGRIVWEKYLGQQVEHHSLSLNINNPYLNEESRYLIFSFGPWGDRKHTRINIDTGETEWEIPLETLASIEGMGDHYYCTVGTDEKVNPIYRVNVNTGVAEHFYSTTLEPHPVSPWGKPGAVARPFLYNNKEYLILAEVRLIGEPTFKPEYFYSLMDAETKELLVKQKPIESPVSRVELVNGELYLFAGNGYKIFSMETLTFKREVRLIYSGDYVYHKFYNDKLIVGIWPNAIDPLTGSNHPAHIIVNLNTHTVQFKIEDSCIYPSAILDDVIYVLPGGQHFWAYNLNTGKLVLDFDLDHEVMFCTATYKNAEGKKFVIVSDIGFTYCFEAI